MEVERRISSNGTTELVGFEWDLSGASPRKVDLKVLGTESSYVHQSHRPAKAICWSYGRTLGNIAVAEASVRGAFSDDEGDDAVLPCDFVDAGKMRNGRPRWWCRTHQSHWGTNADMAAAHATGSMRCSQHRQVMSYVVDPVKLDLSKHAEVGVWCSMPPPLAQGITVEPRHPRLHVHVRDESGSKKVVDSDYPALAIQHDPADQLFDSESINTIQVTPPAAYEFVRALESEIELSCISCPYCKYPHLDLGEFAVKPHRKHLCGNCGRDSIWSPTAIMSTPLKPLHDEFSHADAFVDVDKEVDLDSYGGLRFLVWASTPAVVWTALRPQERGIHVHVYDKNGDYILDDTFGVVRYKGEILDRQKLFRAMVDLTLI